MRKSGRTVTNPTFIIHPGDGRSITPDLWVELQGNTLTVHEAGLSWRMAVDGFAQHVEIVHSDGRIIDVISRRSS